MATVEELEARLDGWESWREEATRRFTAVEAAVKSGQEKLTQIMKNVQPMLDQMAELSSADGQISEALEETGEALAALADGLVALDTRVQGIARVARPGRSVVRNDVAQLQTAVAELRAAVESQTPEEEVAKA